MSKAQSNKVRHRSHLPKNGRQNWYGSFKTSQSLKLSLLRQKCTIELEDGRSGEIFITHQSLPSTDAEFMVNGALE
jgi:hypothetical protein